MANCSTCKFHFTLPYVLEDGGKGDNTFCRFNPPTLVAMDTSAMVPVQPSGWCGQFQVGSTRKMKS